MGIERPLPAADEDVLAGRRDGISMSDDSDPLKAEIRERFARFAVAPHDESRGPREREAAGNAVLVTPGASALRLAGS